MHDGGLIFCFEATFGNPESSVRHFSVTSRTTESVGGFSTCLTCDIWVFHFLFFWPRVPGRSDGLNPLY